jgi:NAD(P)-dependent dehydrogenase (short-subunit alcohol dehydrogenase family)
MPSETRVCVVTGVGPGNGAAFTRKFAAEGYRVAMLARDAARLEALAREMPSARGYPTDVADAASVAAAFAGIRRDLGPVDVLVHNAGSGVFGDFLTVDAATLEQSWRVNTLGLFLCGREAVADMRPRGAGAIVVVGATASLRGGAAFAAFAQAKAAQRALAQSMARTLGPSGIHVALVIVDGVIDIPATRRMLADRPDDFFLQPAAIADTVYHLATQDRSAWTFELDVRPFGEQW